MRTCVLNQRTVEMTTVFVQYSPNGFECPKKTKASHSRRVFAFYLLLKPVAPLHLFFTGMTIKWVVVSMVCNLFPLQQCSKEQTSFQLTRKSASKNMAKSRRHLRPSQKKLCHQCYLPCALCTVHLWFCLSF